MCALPRDPRPWHSPNDTLITPIGCKIIHISSSDALIKRSTCCSPPTTWLKQRARALEAAEAAAGRLAALVWRYLTLLPRCTPRRPSPFMSSSGVTEIWATSVPRFTANLSSCSGLRLQGGRSV